MNKKWTEIPELKEFSKDTKGLYPHLWKRLSVLGIQINEDEAKEFEDLKLALMSIYHPNEEQLIQLGEAEFEKYKRSVNVRFDTVLLLRSIFK